jgi:hypothetical protein
VAGGATAEIAVPVV